MLKVLRDAWKIPELRTKMLFTLLLLVVFRFGSVIPVPWLDRAALQAWMGQGGNTIFGIMDVFSGGAFSQATIFAMGISPYINASIIMQLLTVAIPALERLSKEGVEGRKKITQITRYTTVGIGFVQAAGLFYTLSSSKAINEVNWMTFLTITMTFTAGTAFLMWLGEQITEKGVGNGISLLIFAGIISRIPSMLETLWQNFSENLYIIIIIAAVALAVIAFVVLCNQAERRIPVQYAKRVVGRKTYGGQSSNIPIKVAMAGVIPIIFAMSIMAFPGTIIMLIGGQDVSGFMGWLKWFFSQNNPGYSILYFLLIIGFTFFYTAITFNPIEIANNMKKNGGFIPGIRPGRPTSEFITKVLSKITLVGSCFIAIIAVFPIMLGMISPQFASLSIGGSSLLIVVGVALETTRQLESQMMMRNHKGFLE